MCHVDQQNPELPSMSLAFTATKVTALTGLTKRQIQYWDERRFISPSAGHKGLRAVCPFQLLMQFTEYRCPSMTVPARVRTTELSFRR